MTGNEIRRAFLRYFEGNGHRVVRSSSLIPANDPTLLFANAGMNQFKDVFLGLEPREYPRATTCQKCVRAGGKHNDLETVGFTNRHHTFFEMLGNFSFGDYFKKEAIAFAWELVTSARWFAVPKDRLFVTIFSGDEAMQRDEEAGEAWRAQGVSRERILSFGRKENFWAMGDTGPCGPCSEIHYDLGPAASDLDHADCAFGCDCGRYIEIWNLVFMQFNRGPEGNLHPLPRPSVDTGAGLERLAAVLQHKISNFDTDLFQPLMEAAEKISLADRGGAGVLPSLRIVADHARAATFLVSDGGIPSNEGRGYVLRKIIRRALRHARTLNAPLPFLSRMAGIVQQQMGEAYPELLENAERVRHVLEEEERRFTRTVNVGLKRLEEEIAPLLEQKKKGPVVYPGEKAFRLYDTFGLPLDFIEDVLRDQGIEFEESEFHQAMEEQRRRAKASWKGAARETASPVYAKLAETFRTQPDFYFGTSARDCRIEAILTDRGPANELPAGAEGEIVLDRTAIYAEAGGQVADTGALFDNRASLEIAEVRGAYYPVTGLVAHRVRAKEKLTVGDRVATVADPQRRSRNMRNHTATHLMHAALRNILGRHVKQAGSRVAPDHLRFDFSHYAAVDPGILAEIEQQVNEEILKNSEVQTDLMGLDEALASGALAFFGDRYPEQNVRVVTIPDPSSVGGFYSKELCGGTHVARTGEIGVFKITGEQSAASGTRRIEAITGDRALADYQKALDTLRGVASLLNAGEDELLEVAQRLQQAVRQLERQVEGAQRHQAQALANDLLGAVRKIKEIPVIAARVTGLDREAMRQLVDALRQKLGSGIVVLASADDGKVALITGITKDLTSKLHAGKIVQELARHVGGTGGGRADLAEAGGKDTSGIEKAIAQVYPLVERML